MGKALVTGGGGFLGRFIVERLLERGDDVRILARGSYPELAAMGVDCVQASLTDSGAVSRACDGMDVVFHVAALAAAWGPRQAFYDTNVKGTQNVILGCRERGVGRLVYTSSPSVIFNMESIEGGDESLPYPPRYYAYYPETKAIAEQHVLAANGEKGVCTCSLRPHLIYGPRDVHIVPMLVERARSGKLIRIGEGHNRVDVTYVENAAHAHLLAADALGPDSPVAGQAYFIGDGEPVNLWNFVNTLLSRMNEPTVQSHIPYPVAQALATALELTHRTLPFLGEPRLTRFLASNFAQSHWFNQAKAAKHFGYEPPVSAEEAMDRTVSWFTQNRPLEDSG